MRTNEAGRISQIDADQKRRDLLAGCPPDPSSEFEQLEFLLSFLECRQAAG
jgi:hypothetical protein